MRYGPVDAFQSGVAVPVFSLRSDDACGTGEFLDLPALGRWCVSAGLDLVQILPVNDSGPDPSPYGALSAFALHPSYVRLSAIAGAESFAGRIALARRRLEGDRLDYHGVLHEKLVILRAMHDAGAGTPSGLSAWIEANPWVRPYAAFRALKHRYDQRPWWEWPAHHDPDEDLVEKIWELDAQASFFAWVQHELEIQLKHAGASLQAMGVRLKGDLPILLSADSADVWFHRRYFDLRWQAGAPPDMYSDRGQNWGFPCYDWNALEADDHRWWRQRLRQAEKFYHAYRIDHVLGFFRIWRIPASERTGMLGQYHPATPIQGRELVDLGLSRERIDELCAPQGDRSDEAVTEAQAFSHADEAERDRLLRRAWDRVLLRVPEVEDGYRPRWRAHETAAFAALPQPLREALGQRLLADEAAQQDLWAATGRTRLRMLLESSDMLPCAEDLGAVPECVPRVLEELDILGLRIERWTRDWSAPGHPFLDPRHAPRWTVWSPSGHDTSTLRGWWQENAADRELMAAELGLEETVENLTPEIAQRLLRRTFSANSLLCIVPVQDLLALQPSAVAPDDERVNVPGTLPEHNWWYRMPVTVEALAADREHTACVAVLTAERRARRLS